MKIKLLIIIPAFNEEFMIGQVIDAIPRKISGVTKINIVVIDDGSSDRTAYIAKKHGAHTIKHVLNRGLGGALGTGFEYARLVNCDVIVTIDADGQHNPKNVRKLVKPLLDHDADVVIGSRFYDSAGNMSYARKIINMFSNIATWLLFGIWTTDSQSGMRAFNKNAFTKMRIQTQRMEVSSEILKEIKRINLRMREVPINAIYSEYSLRKGQKITNAPAVLLKLLLHRLQ